MIPAGACVCLCLVPVVLIPHAMIPAGACMCVRVCVCLAPVVLIPHAMIPAGALTLPLNIMNDWRVGLFPLSCLICPGALSLLTFCNGWLCIWRPYNITPWHMPSLYSHLHRFLTNNARALCLQCMEFTAHVCNIPWLPRVCWMLDTKLTLLCSVLLYLQACWRGRALQNVWLQPGQPVLGQLHMCSRIAR
jgi:hypothetical protein